MNKFFSVGLIILSMVLVCSCSDKSDSNKTNTTESTNEIVKAKVLTVDTKHKILTAKTMGDSENWKEKPSFHSNEPIIISYEYIQGSNSELNGEESLLDEIKKDQIISFTINRIEKDNDETTVFCNAINIQD